ncbi:MAG: hypothetical protein KAR20_09025, partial [Candidatus Heimdallarchaeota archaeon]|nr:hypothetical protein [Candidatus Heimdallarchaeota archaeon]
ILINECAYSKGSHTWSDDRRNTKFNGKIFFSAEIDSCKKNDIEKINEMLKNTEIDLKEMEVYAGNGKDHISAELRPIPKTGFNSTN